MVIYNSYKVIGVQYTVMLLWNLNRTTYMSIRKWLPVTVFF